MQTLGFGVLALLPLKETHSGDWGAPRSGVEAAEGTRTGREVAGAVGHSCPSRAGSWLTCVVLQLHGGPGGPCREEGVRLRECAPAPLHGAPSLPRKGLPRQNWCEEVFCRRKEEFETWIKACVTGSADAPLVVTRDRLDGDGVNRVHSGNGGES